MKIQVTQEDIALGQKDHCTKCPVALALIRATGAVFNVTDHMAFRASQTEDYYLPSKVVAFIKDFDAGKEVSPFEFELEIA